MQLLQAIAHLFIFWQTSSCFCFSPFSIAENNEKPHSTITKKFVKMAEVVVRRSSVKKLFLILLQTSKEKTYVGVAFLIKVQALSLITTYLLLIFTIIIYYYFTTFLIKNFRYRCYPANFVRCYLLKMSQNYPIATSEIELEIKIRRMMFLLQVYVKRVSSRILHLRSRRKCLCGNLVLDYVFDLVSIKQFLFR